MTAAYPARPPPGRRLQRALFDHATELRLGRWQLLAVDGGCEVIRVAASEIEDRSRPAAAVAAGAGLAVQPAAGAWSEALRGYRHRIRMLDPSRLEADG